MALDVYDDYGVEQKQAEARESDEGSKVCLVG